MSPLVTIGLETHVQLKSRTKIFCSCQLEFGGPANSHVCPVCLGLPGALPVLNREVFLLGLRAVLALQGTPSTLIKFDRKNYFYPDLPKGYQISQYDSPLGVGGFVEIHSGDKTKKIRLRRLHLEEDAGKLIHDRSPDSSHVDLNRAGTPLAEIVTEPDLESPEEAYVYLMNLKAILRSIGVSDCDMEKGHLRCDANISVRQDEKGPLGKRVEIKNLNSFKAVKAALHYEIGRQGAAVDKGEKIIQETRLWDDERQRTILMRSKEEAHDYRYFPEPDLAPFSVTEADIESEKKLIPMLPRARKERFMEIYGLSDYDASLLSAEMFVADFFEDATEESGNAKAMANWILGPVFNYLSAKNVLLSETNLSPTLLARTDALVKRDEVSLQVAKEKIFPEVIEKGRNPEEVLQEKGLKQVSDDTAIEGWIEEALESNPKVVQDFKSGKETAAMFLVGQVMKKSQGKANPGKVRELLIRRLKSL